MEELREAAASSGSTIEQWQAAYADLQQQQDTAVAELQQLREASGGNDSSIEEWRNAYADLQQQLSSLQVESERQPSRFRWISSLCALDQPCYRLCHVVWTRILLTDRVMRGACSLLHLSDTAYGLDAIRSNSSDVPDQHEFPSPALGR